jgi:hypothetical protein
LNITYFIEGGIQQNYNWTGSLSFLEQDTVVLPVSALTFWLGTADRFTAAISNPNNLKDEYLPNNTNTSGFNDIHVYPFGELTTIQLKTNNVGNQTKYTLYEGDGEVFFERTDCGNNAIYNDSFILPVGCYKLRIDDSGGNGLEFWNQPAQGSGYFNILDGSNALLYAFDPDFGGFAEFEFGIGNITEISEINTPFFLSIYPNPTSDWLAIKIKNIQTKTVSVNLSNAVMANVLQKQFDINGDDFNTRIDMKLLPAGVYFLRISCGNYSKTEKIIKY